MPVPSSINVRIQYKLLQYNVHTCTMCVSVDALLLHHIGNSWKSLCTAAILVYNCVAIYTSIVKAVFSVFPSSRNSKWLIYAWNYVLYILLMQILLERASTFLIDMLLQDGSSCMT